jgi:hypothetical protein
MVRRRLIFDPHPGRRQAFERYLLGLAEAMVWTTPSGRRYACNLNGEPLPPP